MSEAHRQPANRSEFELQDFRPGTLYIFLMGLAAACVVVTFAVWVVYKTANSYVMARQPKNPMVQPLADTRQVTPAQLRQFAQPRLEISERTEINQFRLQEEQRLHSYGWVDESVGVVYIPIDRAMQLIAERGLPTTPKAGEYPPSTINTINQAVQRVDTSVAPPPTKSRTPSGRKVQQ